jgi:hypothetical protein
VVPLLFWCANIRIMSCVCIYSISFYFCHNKLTRQILYVVIYFICKVFLTIHTLVYVITFVLCHHLYLDVCVCVHNYWIYPNCLYYCIQISYRKLQIMNFFLCFVFYSTKNISKTCIAFCWYCFGRDTAKARHRYANNIGYVIMLIT